MFSTLRVVGPSMEPTLASGDLVLVLKTRRIRPGQVLVVEHPDRPDLLVIKRCRQVLGDGSAWIEGDHPAMSDDSRKFGAVSPDRIRGRVLMRFASAR